MRLTRLLERLEAQGEQKMEPNRTDDTGRRDEDHQPLNEMLQAIASGRNRSRSVILKQTREALARLDDEPEMFGLCIDCEEPIPARRLELMPYVARCVPCQSELECGGHGSRKSLTDYV